MADLLIFSTDFSQAGPISAVAAGAVLYDGHRDKNGGIFKLDGAAPNTRLNQNGTTGTHLYRSGANAIQSVKMIAFIDAPVNHNVIEARTIDDGTGKPGDNGYFLIMSAGNITLQFYSSGTSTFENVDIYGWNGVSGPYVVVWELYPTTTNVTQIRTRICTRANWNAVANARDNLGSVTWAVNATYNDNRNIAGANLGRLQAAGWAGIRQVSGVELVEVWNTAAPLARPDVKTTYHDDQKISLLAVTGGGVSPLTIRWHQTATPPNNSTPIAKDTSTEIAGQSGNGLNTLDYTFPDGQTRWFCAKMTDSAGSPATAYSNFVMAGPGLVPWHIIFAGDSYVQGLEANWRSPDSCVEMLKTLSGPRTITYSNLGVSQTGLVAWLPTTDPEYNDLSLSPGVGGFIQRIFNAITAARAANSRAKIILCMQIGINDANNYGNPAINAVSPATFKAQYQRFLAATVNPGTLADVCYMHHPAFVATQSPAEDGANGGTGSRRMTNMLAYRQSVEDIANGTTYKVGDRLSWFRVGAQPQQNQTTGIGLPAEGHPHVADTNTGTTFLPDGYREQGYRWAYAIAQGEGSIGSGGTNTYIFNCEC